MMFNLKSARQEKGYTQQQLSEKSGVSRVAISLIESGKMKSIKTDTLSKLADALDKKPSDLFF